MGERTRSHSLQGTAKTMHKQTGVGELLITLSKGNEALCDELTILLFDELRILARQCLNGKAEACHPASDTLAGRVFEQLFPNLAFSTKRGFYVFLGNLMRETVQSLGKRPFQADERQICWNHLGSLIENERLSNEQTQVATLKGFAGFTKGEVASMLNLDPITVSRLWDEVQKTPALV